MRNSKCNMLVRGFTLIEVLLVMVIISILLFGSLSLTAKYSANLQWNRLFSRLEQLVLDVNTYALAGVSFGFEASGGVIEELPDMYHLLIKKGEPVVWYLESRENGAARRKIVFQERRDLNADAMNLEEIFLRLNDEQKSEEQVLLTWSNPYARLQFYPEASLEFLGDTVEEIFELGEPDELCQENCLLNLEYVKADAEKHAVSFDLQKGIYRDFY